MMFLYTSPTCVKCKQVKKVLEDKSLSFTELDIEDDALARADLLARGYMSLPVLKINDEYVSDFKKILEVVTGLA
jgi:glutaredoxin